jgi:hypothetical protein
MRRFTYDSTRLAFARQRVLTGRDSIGGQRDEATLLIAITEERHRLLAAARPQQYGQSQPGAGHSPVV